MVSLLLEETFDVSEIAEEGEFDDDCVFRTTPVQAAPGVVPPQKLICSTFNQDGSRFAVGTTAGFIVYNTEPELREHSACDGSLASSSSSTTAESILGGPPTGLNAMSSGNLHPPSPSTPSPLIVAAISLLYKSSLCAVVAVDGDGKGSDRVTLWDFKRGVAVSEVRIGNQDPVRGVLLRQNCLIVICDHSCRLFDPIHLRPRRHLTTAPNPHGLCASVAQPDSWLMCCPGATDGEVQILQRCATSATSSFKAHTTALRQLALAEDGRHIATVSEYGSIIRVFLLDGTTVHQLRLGNKSQTISCLVMHPVFPILGVSLTRDSCVYFFHTPGCGRQAGNVTDNRMRSTSSITSTSSLPTGPSSPQLGPEPAAAIISSRGAPRAAILPNYVAYFRIPDVRSDGVPEMDVRAATGCNMVGPLLNFHATEPRLQILHYNGIFHNLTLPSTLWGDSAKGGVKELTAHTRDMFLTASRGRRYDYDVKPVEAEDEDDEWAMIG
mmetsp:Transcript_89416/g.196023  ORF Transcript_89416/g.196023 Transcript_89416/m.196023 type:complete len:496 (+) Transcript_89416:412-1899(+)